VGSLSGGGYGTAGELLNAVAQYDIPLPENHLLAALMDQPF
jgi:hypothetical protein